MSPILRVGICPFCHADLSSAPITVLSEADQIITHARTVDFDFLLQPYPCSFNLPLGGKLASIRQHFGYEIDDIASLLCTSRKHLGRVEISTQVISYVRTYLEYADALGISLREALAHHEFTLEMSYDEHHLIQQNAHLQQQMLITRRDQFEDEIIQQIQDIVCKLEPLTMRFIRQNIRQHLGEHIDTPIYDRVTAYLDQLVFEQKFNYWNQHVEQGRRILTHLKETEQQITVRGISSQLDVMLTGCSSYPAVRKLVRDIVNTAKQQLRIWDYDQQKFVYRQQDIVLRDLEIFLKSPACVGKNLSRKKILQLFGLPKPSKRRSTIFAHLIEQYHRAEAERQYKTHPDPAS